MEENERAIMVVSKEKQLFSAGFSAEKSAMGSNPTPRTFSIPKMSLILGFCSEH
jgi:hypothetical protein